MRDFLRRNASLVVLITLLVSFYEYVTQWSVITTIGGFTLHLGDLLFGLVSVYWALGAVLTQERHSAIEKILMALSGLLLLSFLRGVVSAGAAPAGVQFREFAVFIALIGFMYYWGRDLDPGWVAKMIVRLGWGIALLGLLRLIFGFTLFVRAPPDPDADWRTLNGQAALMLAVASIIALNLALSAPRRRGRSRHWITFAVLLASLLISDQRTATFAALAGYVMILAFLPARQRNRLVFVSCVLAPVCAAGLIGWSAAGGRLAVLVPSAVTMITDSQGTFAWRTEQWGDFAAVYLQASPLNQVIGIPFGVLRVAADPNSMLFIAVHNGYIQLLINVGALGLLLFAIVLAGALKCGVLLAARASRTGVPAYPTAANHRPVAASELVAGHAGTERLDLSLVRLGVAILVAQTVFSIGYTLPTDQGLLLALAIQLVTPMGLHARQGSIVSPRDWQSPGPRAAPQMRRVAGIESSIRIRR